MSPEITAADIRVATKSLRDFAPRKPLFRAWGWPLRITFDKYNPTWENMHGCFFTRGNTPYIYVNVRDLKEVYPHSWIRQSIKTFSHEFTHFVQWLMGAQYWSEKETLLDRYEDELAAYVVGEIVGIFLFTRPRDIEEGAILSTASAATYMLRNTRRAEIYWNEDKHFDPQVIEDLHLMKIPVVTW